MWRNRCSRLVKARPHDWHSYGFLLDGEDAVELPMAGSGVVLRSGSFALRLRDVGVVGSSGGG